MASSTRPGDEEAPQMRLKRDDKSKLLYAMLRAIFPLVLFTEAAAPVLEFIENSAPFQMAARVLREYPDFTLEYKAIEFSADYKGYSFYRYGTPSNEYFTCRNMRFPTSVPYAGKRVTSKGMTSYLSGICFNIRSDGRLFVQGLFSLEETEVNEGSALHNAAKDILSLINTVMAVQKMLDRVLSSTDSLGKIITLIPALQPTFPDEKPIKITESEKLLTMSEELEFVNSRLDGRHINI